MKDNKRKERKEREQQLAREEKERRERTILMRSLFSPDGVNPHPRGYIIINDSGNDVYVRTLYIQKLPKKAMFAYTFRELLNYKNATASVHVEPVAQDVAQHYMDKKIVGVDSEFIAARDRNRRRRMQARLSELEMRASLVESGHDRLFHVTFLFSLVANSLEELDNYTNELVGKARLCHIVLASCYGSQGEGFLSTGPYNEVFEQHLSSLIHNDCAKRHMMNAGALSTIFPHINSRFTHETGTLIGKHRWTGEPIMYDDFNKNLNSYGVAVCGFSGAGKSTLIKTHAARQAHFNTFFAVVDTEKAGGTRGEYVNLAKMLGGVAYRLGPAVDGVEERLNLFEISPTLEYSPETNVEYETLALHDKINSVVNILLSMVITNRGLPEFELLTHLESILKDVCADMYRMRDIIDRVADSLFVCDSTGKRTKKKPLPTISDVYMALLKKKKSDKEESHQRAYVILLDTLRDYVAGLYYDEETYELRSEIAYWQYSTKREGRPIVKVQGTNGYYDGQSTISIAPNTPFIDIDISDVPKEQADIAKMVALSFLDQFIGYNSGNPATSKQRVIIFDEGHRLIGRTKEEATTTKRFSNAFIADLYRSARKHLVSPWMGTQSYKDLENCESALINISTVFLFKHVEHDREWLERNTPLTETQVNEVIHLGGDDVGNLRKGECCMIVNNSLAIFLNALYLDETERYIAETDMAKLKAMH